MTLPVTLGSNTITPLSASADRTPWLHTFAPASRAAAQTRSYGAANVRSLAGPSSAGGAEAHAVTNRTKGRIAAMRRMEVLAFIDRIPSFEQRESDESS